MFWYAPSVERLREGAVDVFNVKEHLERARELLEAGDEAAVRYACLEMRFAIEKIVYRKLSKLAEKIPPAIYRTWQPNKAMKLLLNFEPQADQNVKVAVSSVAEDGSPAGDWSDLGEARAFKLQWLNKYYNKLGGYLHASPLYEKKKPAHKVVCSLREILEELDYVAASSMVMSFTITGNFPCEKCGTAIYFSEEQIKAQAELECYNQACPVRYKIIGFGDKLKVERLHCFDYRCTRCDAENSLPGPLHHEVRHCTSCGQTHHFECFFKAAIS